MWPFLHSITHRCVSVYVLSISTFCLRHSFTDTRNRRRKQQTPLIHESSFRILKKKLFSAWAIPCWHFSLHLSLGLIQWARMCDFFQWLDLLMLKSLKGRLMASFIPTPVYSFYTWTLRRQLACLTVMVGKIPDTRKARTQFQHIHHTHTHTRVTFSSGWKLTCSCFSRSV